MSLFNSKLLTFQRYSPPVNVKGKLIPSPTLTVVARGTLQPVKEEELKQYPSLGTVEGHFRFYTDVDLVFEAGHPDTCIIDGNKYEVFAWGNWQNNIINHKKYILKRVG